MRPLSALLEFIEACHTEGLPLETIILPGSVVSYLCADLESLRRFPPESGSMNNHQLTVQAPKHPVEILSPTSVYRSSVLGRMR